MASSATQKRPVWIRYVVLAVGSVVLTWGLWSVLKAGALPALPQSVDTSRLGWSSLLGYSGAWLVVLFLKAWRWRFQLAPVERVPMNRVLSASVLGYAATLILPFRSGEVFRPGLITRGTRVSFFAAMSTSATERVIDAVFASAILIFSLLNARVIDPLPEKIGDLSVPTRVVTVFGYGAAAASITLVVCAVLFYAFRATAQRLIRNTVGRFSESLGVWLENVFSEFARGLAFLVSSKHAPRFLSVSTAYWATYWASMWFLLSRAGFENVSWAESGVVVGTLAFGMSLPNAPGFFGTFQIAVYASLALFFPAEVIQTDGATFVFWLYALQFGWVFALTPLAAWNEWRARRALPTSLPTTAA